MNTLIEYALTIIGVSAVVVLMVMAVDRPVVQISHPSGECVNVEPVGEYNCDTLPDRYYIEFVSEK